MARKDIDEHGTPRPGSPHVITLRTPDERLVWYRATPARSKQAIKDLGVLDGWPGYLVRNDYAGWHQFDEHLAGVQQCVAHIFRHIQDVLDLHPTWQAWAGEVRQVLREAQTAVREAKTIRWDRAENSPAGVVVVDRVVDTPRPAEAPGRAGPRRPARGRLPLPGGARAGRRRAAAMPQRPRLLRRLGDHADAGLVAVPVRRALGPPLPRLPGRAGGAAHRRRLRHR